LRSFALIAWIQKIKRSGGMVVDFDEFGEGKSMIWWMKSKNFGSGDHGDVIRASTLRTT